MVHSAAAALAWLTTVPLPLLLLDVGLPTLALADRWLAGRCSWCSGLCRRCLSRARRLAVPRVLLRAGHLPSLVLFRARLAPHLLGITCLPLCAARCHTCVLFFTLDTADDPLGGSTLGSVRATARREVPRPGACPFGPLATPQRSPGRPGRLTGNASHDSGVALFLHARSCACALLGALSRYSPLHSLILADTGSSLSLRLTPCARQYHLTR